LIPLSPNDQQDCPSEAATQCQKPSLGLGIRVFPRDAERIKQRADCIGEVNPMTLKVGRALVLIPLEAHVESVCTLSIRSKRFRIVSDTARIGERNWHEQEVISCRPNPRSGRMRRHARETGAGPEKLTRRCSGTRSIMRQARVRTSD
jgi:hypothetical protein